MYIRAERRRSVRLLLVKRRSGSARLTFFRGNDFAMTLATRAVAARSRLTRGELLGK